MSRALYVGPVDTRAINGMTQHQEMLIRAMTEEFRVDVLSLFASPNAAQAWLDAHGIPARVLAGPFAQVARANAIAWQAAGTALACKLKWTRHFPFWLTTALPRLWTHRYDRIFCYYPWGVILLGLDRLGDKITVNLGDVMADRYARIGLRKWISLSPEDERRVVRAPIRACAISQFDADEFRRLYGVALPVSPSVPPQYESLIALAANPRPRAAGFIASGANAINIETLRALAAPAFLDALRAAGITFVVGGSVCHQAPPDVLAALAAGGAVLKGRVPAPTDFYAAVGAMVTPVGPSSGLKMKSVETLLSGRSLITTRWGTDGVFDGFEGQVFVLDWPADVNAMAKAVVAALSDTQSDRSVRARLYADDALSRFRQSLHHEGWRDVSSSGHQTST